MAQQQCLDFTTLTMICRSSWRNTHAEDLPSESQLDERSIHYTRTARRLRLSGSCTCGVVGATQLPGGASISGGSSTCPGSDSSTLALKYVLEMSMK